MKEHLQHNHNNPNKPRLVLTTTRGPPLAFALSRDPRAKQLEPKPVRLLRLLLLQRDGARCGVQLCPRYQGRGPRQRHVLQLPVPAGGRCQGREDRVKGLG